MDYPTPNIPKRPSEDDVLDCPNSTNLLFSGLINYGDVEEDSYNDSTDFPAFTQCLQHSIALTKAHYCLFILTIIRNILLKPRALWSLTRILVYNNNKKEKNPQKAGLLLAYRSSGKTSRMSHHYQLSTADQF